MMERSRAEKLRCPFSREGIEQILGGIMVATISDGSRQAIKELTLFSNENLKGPDERNRCITKDCMAWDGSERADMGECRLIMKGR